MTDMALLQAVLRVDFCAFIRQVFREVAAGEKYLPNWHIEAMAHALSEVGEKRRLRQLIEVPPRSLKSICASVALTAWLLGRDPTRKIICVSYSRELAAYFSALTRKVMKSGWYRQTFPNTVISPEKDSEGEFRTTAGGYRYATSVGGTLTGKGADLIVIDDPGKAEEMASEAQRSAINAWYDNTLYSRLNDPRTGAIVIAMQRLHYEDLAGHVRGYGEWNALTIPAIATKDERIPLGGDRWHDRKAGDLIDERMGDRAALDRRKEAIGSRNFASQYLQDPLPEDGGVIEWKWFKHYVDAPDRERSRIVQSWDCAAKASEFSDYSVCTTWAVVGDDYFLLDVFRKRLTFPELLSAVKSLATRWGPEEILIEDASAGIQLIQLLRLERPSRMPVPLAIPPRMDKVIRAHTVSPIIEQGRVFLPLSTAWLDDLKTEILQFPLSKHDDQIDSISQFLMREERRRQGYGKVQVRPMFPFGTKRQR